MAGGRLAPVGALGALLFARAMHTELAMAVYLLVPVGVLRAPLGTCAAGTELAMAGYLSVLVLGVSPGALRRALARFCLVAVGRSSRVLQTLGSQCTVFSPPLSLQPHWRRRHSALSTR